MRSFWLESFGHFIWTILVAYFSLIMVESWVHALKAMRKILRGGRCYSVWKNLMKPHPCMGGSHVCQARATLLMVLRVVFLINCMVSLVTRQDVFCRMFLLNEVRRIVDWNGEEVIPTISNVNQKVQMWIPKEHHIIQLVVSPQPINYEDKKDKYNKRVYTYLFINKYIDITYSFKLFLMWNIIKLYSYMFCLGKFYVV